MYQPGKAANHSRGQLNRKNDMQVSDFEKTKLTIISITGEKKQLFSALIPTTAGAARSVLLGPKPKRD